jgi:hypothetical protein
MSKNEKIMALGSWYTMERCIGFVINPASCSRKNGFFTGKYLEENNGMCKKCLEIYTCTRPAETDSKYDEPAPAKKTRIVYPVETDSEDDLPIEEPKRINTDYKRTIEDRYYEMRAIRESIRTTSHPVLVVQDCDGSF